MKTSESGFVAATRVRQALVEDGDIRSEIEFQNDINRMIARLEDGSSIKEIIGWAPLEPLAAAAAAARRAGLRQGRPGRRAAQAAGRETAGAYVSLAVSVSRAR